MNAINVVELLSLVCVFTAVCQTDNDLCHLSCDDVIGYVGTEVTLSCSVSQNCPECCFTMFKFQENEKTFCKEEEKSCDQRNTFTCRYTPTMAMKKPFKFFVQRKCGTIKAEFTVNITESSKRETVAKASETKEKFALPQNPTDSDKSDTSQDERSEEGERNRGRGFKFAVIAAVVSCFIIIFVPVVYKMKENETLKKMFQRHNDPPEQLTEQQEQSRSLV